MQCPFCEEKDTRVVDSRLAGDGAEVRRRRECVACRERFTTYEKAELSLPRIIKRDGTRVPFDEDKLRGGMLRALERRPVPSDRVEASIGHIKHADLQRAECYRRIVVFGFRGCRRYGQDKIIR